MKRKTKRWLALLLAVAMLFALAACAEDDDDDRDDRREKKTSAGKTAEEVALAATEATFRGDLDGALRLIDDDVMDYYLATLGQSRKELEQELKESLDDEVRRWEERMDGKYTVSAAVNKVTGVGREDLARLAQALDLPVEDAMRVDVDVTIARGTIRWTGRAPSM